MKSRLINEIQPWDSSLTSIPNRQRELRGGRTPSLPSQDRLWKWGLFLISTAYLLGAPSAFASNQIHTSSFVSPQRLLASLSFPTVKEQEDTDDILEQYPAYLNFVLDAGKRVDRRSSHRLATKFEKLRRVSPELAAKFLSGLRYEMVHRVQIAGASPRAFNTRHRKVRSWVKRFLRDWEQEVDEHLYRAYAYQMIRKES